MNGEMQHYCDRLCGLNMMAVAFYSVVMGKVLNRDFNDCRISKLDF